MNRNFWSTLLLIFVLIIPAIRLFQPGRDGRAIHKNGMGCWSNPSIPDLFARADKPREFIFPARPWGASRFPDRMVVFHREFADGRGQILRLSTDILQTGIITCRAKWLLELPIWLWIRSIWRISLLRMFPTTNSILSSALTGVMGKWLERRLIHTCMSGWRTGR